MAKSYPAQLNPGSFIPTTDVYDVSIIYSLDINSKEFKEFLVRLRQSINTIALALNTKDSAYYVQEEFVNGQVFFPNPALSSTTQAVPVLRQDYRIVINFGALPNNATKSVPHGLTITSDFSFTRIYAVASNTTGMSYIPIPYSSTTAGDVIELNVDAVNVNITTHSNKTAYTITYVILEYIKQ